MSTSGESTNVDSPVGPPVPTTSYSSADDWNTIPAGLEGKDLSQSTGRAVTQRAFDAINDYLQCDMDSILLDFSVLTRMNQAATERYAELNATANDITRKLVGVNERYLLLRSSLTKIDQFDASISALEQAAAELDNETRLLEQKFGRISQ
ncbi:Bloc1s2 protein [Fasciola gigantica]|uniref:Bloc1s2 protein n=1 Tax=Fasciola gigantica TaxID=46835 RepID=A0A504YZ09_FASGI|nr:Bloc1s2 protein [Fasciola gigantica]